MAKKLPMLSMAAAAVLVIIQPRNLYRVEDRTSFFLHLPTVPMLANLTMRNDLRPLFSSENSNLSSQPTSRGSLADPDPEPVPVFCFSSCPANIFLQSHRLIWTSDPHKENVLWWIHTPGGGRSLKNDLFPLVTESMGIRRKRANSSVEAAAIEEVDPDWKIFIADGTDQGGGDWFAWFIKNSIVPVTGWKRIHFITRTISSRRRGGVYVSGNLPENASFIPYIIKDRIDFKANIGTAFRSVTRYFFPVRDDLLQEVDTQFHSVKTQTPLSNIDIHTNNRTLDVAHFWNLNVTSHGSLMRAAVSKAIQQLTESVQVQTNKNLNNTNSSHYRSLSALTDIVGHRAHKGRSGVHQDYVEALLNAKIVVVCQRDSWEDHYRLFEALISGAMVMSDPMQYFPHGLVHKKNIVIYQSIADLKQQILYYLRPQHQSERIQIARQGREIALAQHRTFHRYEQWLLPSEHSTYLDEYGVTRFV